MDYTMMNLVMDLLSGLALFLFGMKYMSDSLQQAAGQKLYVAYLTDVPQTNIRQLYLELYLLHLYSHQELQQLWKLAL